VIAASFAFVAGCKDNRPETSTTQITSAPAEAPRTEPLATAPSRLSEDDAKFLTKAAQGGMLEVALGQVATTHGTAPDIKAFGEQMRNDHSRANEELRQLAIQKGAQLPTVLDDAHKSDLDKLSKLTGPKFDEKYADDMVDDHKTDVDEFREAAKSLTDPDLKAWAQKTLPTLESHLKMAQDMERKRHH